MLDDHQLMDFCQLAQELEMAVLVESHTEEELHRALDVPTPLVGINNRSLHSFHTDIQLTIELKHLIPEDKIIITESGIKTREDIVFMQSHGVNTFLIGEHLMNAPDIGETFRCLMGD
jgi:indole-3-glycerol phosphate synthase